MTVSSVYNKYFYRNNGAYSRSAILADISSARREVDEWCNSLQRTEITFKQFPP